MAASAPVTIVDYADLLSTATSPALAAALRASFDFDGPGIIAVRGVPGFVAARARALPFAFALGYLSPAEKLALERPDALYSFGWSHGKEQLSAGVPDTLKGSFYFNPTHDVPTTDPALLKAFPTYCAPNVWPAGDVLAGFQDACCTLSRIMVEAGGALAAHCDALTAPTSPAHADGSGAAGPPSLRSVVMSSRCHKARLLYYFPPEQPAPAMEGGAAATAASGSGSGGGGGGDGDVANYCGWHNDHGCVAAS